MPEHEYVDAVIDELEVSLMLAGLVEAGLVEETVINGEPHFRLTDAGLAYAEQVAA